jgi:hypothetical protein
VSRLWTSSLWTPTGGGGRAYLRRTRGSAAFDPTAYGTVVAWYKADAITGKVDGDALSAWNDSSAAGHNLAQATGSKQPLYKTGIQNGLPVVRFDGVDDFLKVSFTQTQPETLFVVYKIRTWGSGNVDMDGGGTAGAMALRESSTNGVSLITTLGFEDQVLATGVSGAFHVLTGYYDELSGNNSTLQLDGGTPDTGDAGSTGAGGGVTLGANSSGTNAAAIDVAEYLLYSGTCSDPAAVRSYLKTKWGTP